VTKSLLLWRGLEGWRGWATCWRAEVAEVSLEADRLSARGTQLGVEPEAYRLDYELTTGDRYVTERLKLVARTGAEERRLELRRAEDGTWSANGEPMPDVEGALDCDLNYSPVTNSMPVLREGLRLDGARSVDLVMAWVDVPGLTVTPSQQRYEPVDGHTVRYLSPDGFRAEIELDDDGLVTRYPYLAERVEGLSSGAA
jgi:uncharacterized protein